ncbi:GLPGLI family protein [Dyadobacter jejuensis]|uniref:GLPGLI family protein n=2 Tax=Dyadobacter jejuensis TaxID=1082580 RepID=A0A316AJ55_9BACT|nr:GLPGLI family protein [Dyadobacter jejuensis]
MVHFTGLSQGFEGVVTYEKTSYWSKILNKLTYLSEEERSRSQTSWGSNDEGDKSRGRLGTNGHLSKYEDLEKEADGGYQWRKSEYIILHDYDQEKKTEVEEFSGKVYIISDSLKAPKWKILNKIKEVNGYLCMMATTEDTLKGQKITAWFANDLASSAGPERYFGLPGLIMEVDVNDGEVLITAVKVEKKSAEEALAMPKKLKGKRVKQAEYDKMIADFVETSMKSHRNPYYFIRY